MDYNLLPEITAALNGLNMHPHSLRGQNFLISSEVVAKIMALGDSTADMPIVEIGSGLASLSKAIVSNRSGAVDLIEIETLFAQRLKDLFAQNANVTIHCADALTFNYLDLHGKEPYVIYGNIPYNITTPLIEKLLFNGGNWQKMILMLQKEAAQRLCYGQKKDNGPLPLMLDYLTEHKIAFTVPAEAFYPRPAVESAVIEITRNKTVAVDQLCYNLRAFIDAAFSLRRKTLANSLAASSLGEGREYWSKIINICGFPENVRAESLDINDMLKLYQQHNSR